MLFVDRIWNLSKVSSLRVLDTTSHSIGKPLPASSTGISKLGAFWNNSSKKH